MKGALPWGMLYRLTTLVPAMASVKMMPVHINRAVRDTCPSRKITNMIDRLSSPAVTYRTVMKGQYQLLGANHLPTTTYSLRPPSYSTLQNTAVFQTHIQPDCGYISIDIQTISAE